MAESNVGSIIRELRWMLSADQFAKLSDAQLLKGFVDQRDESAFAALLQRHGRLILGLCRSVLHHVQDAEDVFQATFLILAHKAHTIQRGETVGTWLYQTANRLAHKARLRASQRRALESRVATSDHANPADDVSWREVREILDLELGRLPEKLRAPVIMCYFEGRTQEEAARHLGWQVSTIQARLARARELLRGRLARHGLPFGSAVGAAVLSSDIVLAHVPARVAQAICRAATLSAEGEKVSAVVSTSVAAIVQGALREMAMTKILKLTIAAVLLTSVLGGSVGYVVGHASSAAPNNKQQLLAPAKVAKEQAQKPEPPAAVPPLIDARGDPLPVGAFLRLGTQRLRHGGGVMAVAWSPNSNWIASGGSGFDPTLRFWEAGTGKQTLESGRIGNDIASLAISPDGKWAVSVDVQGLLTVLDTTTAKVKASMARPLIPRASVAFTSNGTLATIDQQGLPCLLGPLPALKVIQTFRTEQGPQQAANCVTIANNGQTLAWSNNVGQVFVLDAVTGKVKHNLKHDGKVDWVSLSPDGKLLATPSDEKSIDVWDMDTGKMNCRLEGHKSTVKAVSWSPDSKTLASASEDRTARLWDVEQGKEVKQFTGHRGPVACIAFSPDGNRVASGSYVHEYSLHVWDANTAKDVVEFDEHYGGMRALAVLDGGKKLVSSGNDAMIRLWDLASGKCLNEYEARRYHPKAIAVSPDSKLLALGAAEGGLRLLELPSGKEVKLLTTGTDGIRVLAFSADGKFLGTSDNKKRTQIWDIAAGKLFRDLGDPAEDMIAMAFSPDGKLLCTANRKSVLRVWDVQSGKEISRLGGHKGDVEPILFSPAGMLLASVSTGSAPKVWDIASGKAVRTMGKLTGGYSLAFSPDGRMLITGGADGVIHLWEVATGMQRATFAGHHGAVVALAVLPDGKTLVSGGTDSVGMCWDLTGRRGQKADTPLALTDAELEAMWQRLRDEKADLAYSALLTLAAHPARVLPKLQKELQPVATVDSKIIARWISQIDDSNFAVRQKAMEELKKVVDAATPALRKVYADPPSLEAQARIKLLIGDQSDPLLPNTERLRSIRWLELLDRLDTAEARQWVQRLAEGAPDAWLTQEAKRMAMR